MPVTLSQLAELLDQHAAALAIFARTRCDSPDDVVQEAFIALAAVEPPPDEPRAWLFSVVRRRAMSAARSAVRRRQHESQAAQPSETWFAASVDDRLDAQAVTSKLMELPAAEREIIVLRLWGGLTFREIADVVESSSSTVQRSYEAALANLRKSVNKPCLPTNTAR